MKASLCALLSLALFTLLHHSAQAELTISFDNGAITYPYVLDSDLADGNPATNRHTVESPFQVTFTVDDFFESHSGTYLIAYQILDENDQPVELEDGDPAQSTLTGFSAAQSVSISTFAIPPAIPVPTQTLTFTAQPDPEGTLANQGRYRVRAELRRQTSAPPLTLFLPTGDSFTTAERPLVHFTNTAPFDLFFNARARLDSLTWSKTYALSPSASDQAFEADIDLRLYRWDNFGSAPSAGSVTMIYDYDLIETSSGTSVPLENNGVIIEDVSIATHFDLFGKFPSQVLVNRTHGIVPTSSLDSVSETYELRCQVSHRERLVPTVINFTDGELNIASERLLHYNGTLQYGALSASFDEFGAPVTMLPSTPTELFNQITIAANAGRFVNRPDLRFSGGPVTVQLLDGGDAVLNTGSLTVTTDTGGLVGAQYGDFSLSYATTTMTPSGLRASNPEVSLPQGFQYFPDANANAWAGEPVVTAPLTLNLTGSFLPNAPVVWGLPVNAAFSDESHPLLFQAGGKTLTLTSSQLLIDEVNAGYVHATSFLILEALATVVNPPQGLPIDARLGDKPSNDRYLKKVSSSSSLTITVRNETTRSSIGMLIEADTFETHFPKEAKVSFANDSTLSLVDGVHQATSALEGSATATVGYLQTCPGDMCTEDIDPVDLTHEAVDGKLSFTTGGGLQAPGNLTTAHELQWGKRSPTLYAHRTDAFTDSRFFSAGYQLYAVSGDSDDLPGQLLLADASRTTPGALHLPNSTAHEDGLGDAPGLNFDAFSGQQGGSRLASSPTDFLYTLIDAASNAGQGAKYYVRESGVSGRQCARPFAGAQLIDLYDFPTQLTRFQLSFLSNDNERPECDSWIDGETSVDGTYSQWSQLFTGLRLDCFGNPTDLTPDLSGDNALNKGLQYWNSTFDLKAMRFEPRVTSAEGVCPKTFTAEIVVGAKTLASHVEQPLYGQLAFCSDGRLSTTGNPLGGVTSTLRLPASIPLDSPSVPYQLTPVSELRFSDPGGPKGTGGGPLLPPDQRVGFVSFAATIDIPYFKDLQVHALTTARSPVAPNGTLYLTPTYDDGGGKTWFTHSDFDPTHRGYPNGITLENFRNPQLVSEGGTLPDDGNALKSEPTLIKAEQSLFGLVDLKYPLRWDFLTRKFSSIAPLQEELFITELEHQVQFIDAKFANVSFGAEYDGLPQLKLSNFLNGEIDKASEALSDLLQNGAKEQIDKGLSKLDELLEDSLEKLIDQVVDQAAGPGGPICLTYDLIQDLQSQYTDASQNYNDFRNDLRDILVPGPGNIAFVDSLPPAAGSAITEWQRLIDQLQSGTDDALSIVNQVDGALAEVLKGLNILVQGVDVVSGGISFNDDIDLPEIGPGDVKGLLFKNAQGEYEIVQSLVQQLLPELLPEDVAGIVEPLLNDAVSSLNDELNKLLEDQKPTLDQIRTILIELRKVVVDVRSRLKEGQDILNQIKAIGNRLSPEAILNPAGQRAWKYFEQMEQAVGIGQIPGSTPVKVLEALSALTKDEFIGLIKSEIKNQILGSDFVQEMKFLLRQMAYDLADQITSALQSALNEVTKMMKQLVKETVGALEEEINPLLGAVSDYMGSGELSGYAEVNGDSLRKLRLDGAFQLKVPDEMGLNVFLEIIAYNSEDNFTQNGCIEPGEKAVEVRIGATDLALEWISDIRADVCFKVSLKGNDKSGSPVLPTGVMGKLDMTDGELDFQGFKVSDFGAAVAVGIDECFLAARARALFSSYEMAAGIFFGRTCTLEPLLLVDPDIGDVVKPGTAFTGAYVYGEVWLPISELVLGVPASCLFRIDAGVGAGAFFFVEGPTFGGKMLLGVSGEALCIVSIKGEVKMLLASQAGDLRGSGTGKFSAKIGPCPFCIKFSKSVKILYDNGSWSFN